ncbi:MAG: NADH-quinone oxidoreductase subunit L, partial [Planctomycetes bacterium]|nr:NADH-quinone oxidoreductase subunit L [Planctomycetota bacterium]
MFSNYEWLLLLFPLVGVIINGLFGHKLSRRLVAWIACLAVGLSFLVALTLLWAQMQMPADAAPIEVTLMRWMTVGDFTIDLTLLIDSLSVLMAVVVTGVSTVIHVYSVGYMADDKRYSRYFTFMNLFVFSMLILVLGNNFLMMYVGWEAVGLCSYLLIGFWFERPSAADAGKKAFLVNRIGDFGFALGIMLIFATFGSLDFSAVFANAPLLPRGGELATTMALLLFMGAVGKSAQIPLYVWLPDAMEGPTPVSALIHAATMVTAGVYMVARNHVLFERAPAAMNVVMLIGLATAFFAATMALTQYDMKRVLAYSTISQLGYMFVAVGVGAYAAGMFHLTTHAFFKALLFLGAGSVMHALSGELDIRKMGDLKGKLPTTYRTFLIGALALAGFPLFSGFFSKDEILWEVWVNAGPIVWAIGLITAFMTAFYTFRLVFMAFWGKSRLDKKVAAQVHESPSVMTVPLIILAALAAVAGFVGLPGGLSAIHNFLAPAFVTPGVIHAPAAGSATEWILLVVSAIVSVLGIYLAYHLYVLRPELPKKISTQFSALYNLLVRKYYVDEAYMEVIVKPLRDLGGFLGSSVDRGLIDGIVNGVGRVTTG